MRFGVGIPNVRDYGDPRLMRDIAVDAEAAGWDGVFVWDHLLYRDDRDPVADPWVALAAIAQATHTVRLGVMVAALARRRPWKVAREAATLDVLSGGRLIFGAGLGSLATEYSRFGEDPDPRVRADKLDEALDIVTRLWSGEPVARTGRYFTVDAPPFLPVPAQARVPVWIAGRWPNRRPFRRAARWDGAFATAADVGPAQTMTPARVREIAAYTVQHRRRPGAPDVVVEGCSTARGPDNGHSMQAYAEAGLTWWVEKLGWFRGPVDDMRARVREGPPRA